MSPRSAYRVAAVALAWCLTSASSQVPRAAAEAPRDLAGVFSRGAFLRDQNGDGLIDGIAAKIVIPAQGTPEDLAAASNIAARLGFESSAFTPGLGVLDREIQSEVGATPLILVGGANSLVRRLAAEKKIDLEGLAPGQGVVALVPAAFGEAPALVVAGADPAGTLAAGVAAAARLPYVWQLRGDSLPSVLASLQRFLQQRGVRTAASSAMRAVYEAGSERIALLNVTLDAGAEAARAAAALEDVARAHTVGAAVFTDRLADTLNFYGLDVLEVTVGGRTVRIPRFGPPYSATARGEDGSTGAGNPWKPSAKTWGLGALFTTEGVLGDSRGEDRIPDETETSIIVGPGAAGAPAVIDLAARIALESTGVSLPLVKVEHDVPDPAVVANPILVGTERLEGMLPSAATLAPGEGGIRLVPTAFGTFPAVVIEGGDAAGLNAAARHVARSIPYLGTPRKGEDSLPDVEDEVRAFFRARSNAGQAAAAVDALETTLRQIEPGSLESIEATAYLEEADPALAAFLDKEIRRRVGDATVTASAPSRYGPVPIFEESPDLGWEVDDLRRQFQTLVLPQVRAGETVEIDATVSEGPEIRRGLEQEMRQALAAAGAADARVRVISAYKQGFSWVMDYALPALAGKPVASVTITFPNAQTSTPGHAWYGLSIRWLQELFPIDWIAARQLGIPVDATTFVKRDGGPLVYELEAKDRAGRILLSDRFAPRFVEREYFPAKPTARFQYTTGGLVARAGSRVIADVHVRTDPERFWDYYQTRALPRMFEYVRGYTGGQLGLEHQPFFRDLIFDITMSEPDFRLDVDEERISSLDSLHEDLMFNTIDFWGIFAGNPPGNRRVAPGRIMPMIHPVRPGPPKVTIAFKGNAVPTPRLVLAWKTRAGLATQRTIELRESPVGRPRTTAIRVRAGADRLAGLTVTVDAPTVRDATSAARLVEHLGRLQDAGVLREALASDALDVLTVSVGAGRAGLVRSLASANRPPVAPVQAEPSKPPDPSKPIVTWDHVIAPDEFEAEILPRLRSLPAVNAYVAGRSYRGRRVWAMDVMLPHASEVWSQARATALKPVLFITTRQHANEVSATSAGLRLVELLARDPAYRRYLERINVVVHPFENPDGAANHAEFSRLQPTYILHAGYWSAVGRDVGAYVWNDDPLLPEALVRRRLYYAWLPDIYINPHGYPTHEWVHQFAGYQNPWFMAFWIPRGYHINLHHLDDPDYPAHKPVALELRERIIEEVQGVPAIRATNERLIQRFEKYARRYEPDPFRLEVYKGMNILFDHSYSFRTGPPFDRDVYVRSLWRQPDPHGSSFLERHPQITVLDLGSDMPDETASPQWMETMAARGQFGYLMANVRLLAESAAPIQRLEQDFGSAVRLSLFRPRPVTPAHDTPSRPASAP